MIPVVAGETVYTGGREAGITALDTTTGAIRWALPFEGAGGGGMAVTGGLLIVATLQDGGGGRVVALADPADPRHAARATPAPAATEPAATPSTSLPLKVSSVNVIPGSLYRLVPRWPRTGPSTHPT